MPVPLARALGGALGETLLRAWRAEEAAAVLDLTRVVAHTSERRFAPLVAYAVGLTAGRSPDPPARVARVREVLAVVRELGREAGADDGG